MSDRHVPEKKTVMVCDDDPDLRLLFSMALKSKYNVLPADCGENCIEKFIEEKNNGNKIDLILLDYRLGDMFGDSVARTIKEHNGTKIILISAYELESELIRELKENRYITTYVAKPVQIPDLIEIVANTIH